MLIVLSYDISHFKSSQIDKNIKIKEKTMKNLTSLFKMHSRCHGRLSSVLDR